MWFRMCARLVTASGAGVILLCSSAQVPAQTSASAGTIAEQYLLRSINTERAAAGLPPVIYDPELRAAALSHAAAMARVNTLSHRLQGEPDLSIRGASAGAHFSRITENVAVGPSVPAMHDALMRSERHRDNILDVQVNSVGVAVVQANGSLWAVEDFSRRVEWLTLEQQEQRVTSLLRRVRVDAEPSNAAREMCSIRSGYVGARPAFTMRYATGDLSYLPEQLKLRLASEEVRYAAVGACNPEQNRNGLTTYNIAVVLYR